MTSHIFMALGMWDDVVTANERAQATVPTFLIPHAVTWLGYGLMQQGRYADAQRWIDSMYAQATSAKGKGAREQSMAGVAELSASWNASTNRWTGRPARLRVDTAGTDFTTVMLAIGLGALGRGERALADSAASDIALARRADSVRVFGMLRPQPGDLAWHGVIRLREHTLRALVLRLDGQRDSALALLRAAAAIEQSVPVEFGPPATFKPPHEAAGDVLLEMGRFADAEAEYRLALARTYAELVEIWKRADDGIAEVAEARAGAANGPSRDGHVPRAAARAERLNPPARSRLRPRERPGKSTTANRMAGCRNETNKRVEAAVGVSGSYG